MNRDIPHIRIVIGVCVAAIVGYAVFSVWTLAAFSDATMVGDIVGTWKSFAVAAFAFWLGSSSGGKATAMPEEGSTTTTTTTTNEPPPGTPDAPAEAIPQDAVDAAHQTAGAAVEQAEKIEAKAGKP